MRMWEDNIKMSVWLRFVWLAQDKDKCPAVVNTVMDILFHNMRGFSLPSEEVAAYMYFAIITFSHNFLSSFFIKIWL